MIRFKPFHRYFFADRIIVNGIKYDFYSRWLFSFKNISIPISDKISNIN